MGKNEITGLQTALMMLRRAWQQLVSHLLTTKALPVAGRTLRCQKPDGRAPHSMTISTNSAMECRPQASNDAPPAEVDPSLPLLLHVAQPPFHVQRHPRAEALPKIPSKIAKFHLQIVENRLEFQSKSYRHRRHGPHPLGVVPLSP